MRLFIAINFDEITKEKLLTVQERLKEYGTGNFSRPENLHLTLLFLGEMKDYSSVIKSIDRHFKTPVNLTFSKTGKFKNNIYWVGIKENSVLNELYLGLCKDLSPAELQTADGYSPHITIGREIEVHGRPDLSFEDFSMTAHRVSLMKSERINGVLTYTEIYGKSI